MKPDLSKPKATIPTIPRAIKRERPTSPCDDRESKRKAESIAALQAEVKEMDTKITTLPIAAATEESTEPSAAINGYTDDMDYSILEDDENQFGENQVDEKKEIAVAKTDNTKVKNNAENFETVLSTWESICKNDDKNDDDDDLLSSVDVGESISQATGSKEMKFWFWDAWEEPVKFPGKVYLFGKTISEKNPKEFQSVCIKVENVDRCLYVLPRKRVSGDCWPSCYCSKMFILV